jgi:hypothetical protein
MDDRWKTAEAKKKAGFATARTFVQFLDQLENLDGMLDYHLRGEGSSVDVGARPPGARQPQEDKYDHQEKRVLEQFQRQVADLRRTIGKVYGEARKVDRILR